MKLLELFSGNGDITKAICKKGYYCISVDYDESKHPDIVADVYELDENWLKQFDFIWLSPDCTTYSFASHGIHRIKGGIPVSDYAKQCDINNEKLVNLLLKLNIPFIIENPRAHLRHMGFMQSLKRITVTYATYGASYTKPTDLFSNVDISSFFNTSYNRGTIHLDYAITNYKDFLGRCKIPERLIDDITNCMIRIGKEHYAVHK